MTFLLAAFFLTTAHLQKDRLRALGGPLSIEVRNSSEEKLRADVVVQEQVVTLEMDPGEGGTVRFSPTDTTPILLRVYRTNVLQREIEEGAFPPNVPANVRFEIESTERVLVTYPEST